MNLSNDTLDPLEIDVGSVAASRNEPSWLIVDVREPEEWNAGRIDGSVWIQLDTLTTRTGEIDPSKQVVVVCRSGRRSLIAAQWLAENGFPGAKSMAGGLLEWVEKGNPLTAGE